MPSGVAVALRDGRTIRARYLIAADGIRSTVRTALGIPTRGPGDLGDRLSVLFRAPLWEVVGEHRHVIYFLSGEDGPTAALPVGLPDRWVYARDWDPRRERLADVTPEQVTRWLRLASGVPDLEPEIESVGAISYGVALADRFRAGSAFLIGDAAHRVTPRGATGMNTAIRDGYDLGWKLAWVLRGWAGERAARHLRGRAPAGRRAQRRPLGGPQRLGAHRRRGAACRSRRAHRPHLAARRDRRGVDARPAGRRAHALHGPRRGLLGRRAAGTPPVTVRRLDAMTARAIGIAPGGSLLVRPDGVPAALQSGEGGIRATAHA